MFVEEIYFIQAYQLIVAMIEKGLYQAHHFPSYYHESHTFDQEL